ncbi:MAG: type II secretion system protein M [Myxococcales bacterium]|nr:type II secretion system protein M [Myxococcales bacterium]
MRERWERLQERYLELTLRERIMVLCALLASLFGVVDAVFLLPMDREREQLQSQLSQHVASIKRLDERAEQLAQRIAGRTPTPMDREETALKRQIEIMNADIEEHMSSMIAPNDVTRMLEELLSEESDLTLVKLMSTNPATFPPATEAGVPGAAVDPQGQTAEKAEFYRHGFVIELEGSYLATLHYLESIESLPWDLSWDTITYTVIDYPRARISIHLHTLSREENWIGV